MTPVAEAVVGFALVTLAILETVWAARVAAHANAPAWSRGGVLGDAVALSILFFVVLGLGLVLSAAAALLPAMIAVGATAGAMAAFAVEAIVLWRLFGPKAPVPTQPHPAANQPERERLRRVA